jgi:hypothetical protein
VTIWEVANAGHIQGLDVVGDEWTDRVVRFLDEALDATRQSEDPR